MARGQAVTRSMRRQVGIRCNLLAFGWLLSVMHLLGGALWGAELRFQSLSQEDGLTSGRVNCTLQDRHGFIWIGTDVGLNKYDGQRITTYRFIPSDFSVSAKYGVSALHEDDEGILWLGTKGYGLARFDPVSEEIEHFRKDPNDPGSLSGNYTTSIVEDRKGSLWIGTIGGLNRLDKRTGQFTRYLHDPLDENSLSWNAISSVAEDRLGNIWVGTVRGLNRLNPQTGQFERYLYEPSAPQVQVESMIIDLHLGPSGTIWIACGDGRIYRTSPETGTLEPYFRSESFGSELGKTVPARFVFEDDKGFLWIGLSARGLRKVDLDSGRVVSYHHEPANPSTLASDLVWSIYQDFNGWIWVGTIGEGASRFIDNPVSIKRFEVDRRDPHSLNGQAWAIHEGLDRSLWVGEAGAGLDRYDPETGRFSNYHNIPTNSIRSLYESPLEPGVLWIGTIRGLERYDYRSGASTHYTRNPDDPNSLSGNHVMCIYEDSRGRLWMGTNNGLDQFDRNTGRFRRYPASQSWGGTVRSIVEESPGVLWLGVQGGGLIRFDVQSGTADQYRHSPRNPYSLTSDNVNVVTLDTKGRLWIGTEAGVCLWDREGDHFVRYRFRDYGASEESWVPHDEICGILEDDNGNLWISTGDGIIVKFEGGEHAQTFRRIQSLDGEYLGAFNVGAYYKGQGGELYFGGPSGLYQFDASLLEDSSEKPKVFITDVSYFERSDSSSSEGKGMVKRNVTFSDSATLPANLETITFYFAALDYSDPNLNQFAYKLDGLHDRWIQSGSKAEITFNNLGPGAYNLNVRAANSRGIWNEEGASLAVTILPAWWQTWWARTLAVLILSGFIWGIVWLRVRDVKKRNARLQWEIDERHRIEESLRKRRDELAHVQRVATMGELTAAVAHEINQPLAAIRSNAQAAKRFMIEPEPDLKELNEILDDIISDNRRASEVIVRLRELMQKQSIETNPFSINTVVKEVVGLLHSESVIRNMSIRLDLENGIPNVIGNRIQLQQVLLNLIGNAFDAMEHSSDPERELIIKTSYTGGDTALVSVRDNGRGLGDQNAEKLFDAFATSKKLGMGMGLAISRSIIEAHGGKIWAENNADQGATFCFTLPIETS